MPGAFGKQYNASGVGIAAAPRLWPNHRSAPPEREFEYREMLSFFISADWSKSPGKRCVYLADLRRCRLVKPPEPPDGWSLASMLALARKLSGRVLVGVDVGMGVPYGFWRLALAECGGSSPGNFAQWLANVDSDSGFFETAARPDQWSPRQPWFAVGKGPGGLTAFTGKTSDNLHRRLAAATNAKPIFAVSGIPGSVGSGTREIWRELVPMLKEPRDFAVWPFEGDAEFCHPEHEILLAETYPGLAYGAVLADELPAARLVIAKRNHTQRVEACKRLAAANWVRESRVELPELEPALTGEDDFDALFTAAAVLRCAVESLPIVFPRWIDAEVEGSMLLAGPVDPARKAVRLQT